MAVRVAQAAAQAVKQRSVLYVEMTNEKFKEWLKIRETIIVGLVIVIMIVLFPTVPVQAGQEMSPERFSYIYNVCTGRILVADLAASGYCFQLNLCLDYKSAEECYTDLKNGLINNFWLDLLD